MKDNDSDLIEPKKFIPEDIREELDFATSIVVENGSVISIDRFHEILREQYDVEITIDDTGAVEYGVLPDDVLNAFSVIQQAIRTETRPHELGITAEQRNMFSEYVTAQFNEQLANADENNDPFPLEASVPTGNKTDE